MNSNSTTLDAPKASAATSTSADDLDRPASPDAPRRASRFGPRNIVLGLVAIAIIAWLAHFAWHAYHYESTDDAYIAGHLHRVSAEVGAKVKQVLVNDNQTVSTGDVLVVLDPTEFQIALDKAKGELAQAKAQSAQAEAASAQADAQLAVAQAHVSQAESQKQQLQAQLDLARLNLTRTEQLFHDNAGAATQADLDNVRSQFSTTQAAFAAAEANLVAAQAAVKSSYAARAAAAAQADAAKAAIATAQAAVRDAELKLSYTKIVAPAKGRIGNKAVEVGDRMQPGQALLAIASPDVWVVANFKETQLTRMRPGENVEVTVDALPDQTLHGHLDSLSPASGAEFALLPPDNATGNFNKVVQRVPVKIVLDPADLQRAGDRLQLGLSVVPEVRVR